MLAAYHKLLIANRGEIACRVINTAKRLGIPTVAVFSEADANAKHTQMADEAYYLGPSPSRESYLCIDKILAVAKQSGANAIHPGYGFLAENEAFAKACTDAGFIFIGPSASAIRMMGSKSEAKTTLAPLGIPLIPGYHGKDQDLKTLEKQALTIGFPLLIKAAAGGGGRGMRKVSEKSGLKEAIEGAKREALASFGDDTLLIEKYIEKPRHIEIQLFADSLGQAVYLFERDCSIQRRHQKIVEEAPAVGLPRDIATRMGEAAVLIAKTIAYEGAGTIEFLVDENLNFYFMEMNTRLQVEHPVTEKITGLDLVEWQLRIAAGEPLPLLQEALNIHGHAIEVRICAEDPYEQFTPASGRLTYVGLPDPKSWLRIDTGFGTGDTISRYYDSMIAKLIVWGETREQAILHLQQALTHYTVSGLASNRDLLLAISQTPAYQQGDLSTKFIEEHSDLLTKPELPDAIVAVAAAYVLLNHQSSCKYEPNSPWATTYAWQNGLPATQSLRFKTGTATFNAKIIVNESVLAITINQDKTFTINITQIHTVNLDETKVSHWQIEIDGHTMNYEFVQTWYHLDIFVDTQHYQLEYLPLRTETLLDEGEAALHAPMPAAVIAIPVKLQQTVKQGEPLMVLEAMKMEHTIFAPFAGTVTAVYFDIGHVVQEGSKLIELEPLTH